MRERPEKTIGVLDTYHSKAGWAVAYVGRELGKRVVNFWPKYKADKPGELRVQQLIAARLGATLYALPAGRSAILYHKANRIMRERFPGGYLMPNALKLEESVTETAEQVDHTAWFFRSAGIESPPVWVVSISSGTIAAGVLSGLLRNDLRPEVYLHMGYSRSHEEVRRYLRQMTCGEYPENRVHLVDEGYAYKDRVEGVIAPFPCNPYYDLKAWDWMRRNRSMFDGREILFWNIGE
jgi:hypothetical protein